MAHRRQRRLRLRLLGLLPLSVGVLLAPPPALAAEATDADLITVIGIDLGSTYAAVGVYHGDRNRTMVIPNARGERTTPAYVAFTDTGPLVGQDARDRAFWDPKRVVYGVKHLLGRTFDDPQVQRLRDLVPYDIVDRDGKPYISVQIHGEQHVYSPEEISAMVLTQLKNTSESFLERTVKRALITVPQHFTQAQRQAAKDAGALAGLDVMEIMNDPAAAGHVLGLDNKRAERNALVFHLGGGSCGACVVVVDGPLETYCAHDPRLGGEDFTRRVVDYFVGVVDKKFGRNIRGDAGAMQRLWGEAEGAKHALSSVDEVVVKINGLVDGLDLLEPLSRARFEDLNQDLFDRAMSPVDQALEAAHDVGAQKSGINEIWLVGGSSRIPRIQDLVKEWAGGMEPVRVEGVDPDVVVALGAAERGAFVGGAVDWLEYSRERYGYYLMMTAAYSIGIETAGGLMATLVSRNTILAATKSKVFSTAEDNQEAVTIRVFEGERGLTRDNHWLGAIELRGIAPAPRGVPRINVTIEVDRSGNFTVCAQDLATGREEKIQIPEQEGRLDGEHLERIVREAEANMDQDRVVRSQLKARNLLTGWCYILRSAAQFEHAAPQDPQVHGGDQDQISVAVQEALDWLDANPDGDPKEARARRRALAGACKPLLRERAAAGPGTAVSGPFAAEAQQQGGCADVAAAAPCAVCPWHEEL
ncbi:hypothetical protein HYH03_017987 [Edaphochlamys debaryana]|uniref:Uncharacterized protein n=1 Tax=Edaphochlamys debaryana TaxID=47281 RepID=A0A835XIX4_9CHLO|nr:hypothetical protein HYH03_017987 [Edaphochlamys debaryana]|eukprot:KAG2483141.1 hypothetical protein HYH03_017987 [Edaphochlamys debaryana]